LCLARAYSYLAMFLMRLQPESEFANSGTVSNADLLATSKKNFLLSFYSLKGLGDAMDVTNIDYHHATTIISITISNITFSINLRPGLLLNLEIKKINNQTLIGKKE